jgi:uncharacterized protein
MPIRVLLILIGALALSFAFDVYGFQLLKAATRGLGADGRRIAVVLYWAFPAIAVATTIYVALTPQTFATATPRAWAAGLFLGHLLFVFILAVFAFADDLRMAGFAVLKFIGVRTGTRSLAGLPVTRSAFLSQAALALAAIPAVGLIYGVAAGGHRYQVLRRKVYLPNLPAAFEGFTILQLSDIHAGSFFSRAGVQKGIDLVNAQAADLVVFTGDLVNNVASEIEPWIPYFKKITAPSGVYSILGNHDYGDYAAWPSAEAKAENLEKLREHHAALGWQLLQDEHRMLQRGDQQIALLGIQNWGARAGFPKYGNLAKAHAGTDAAPVKILLSHDPSHWQAQVRPQFPDIDLMLAGHTHGMQFGIDTKYLKWSPVQYVYKEWADLYQEGAQYLYVNRGFGFIGYPGRFGIWPEITVLELTAKAPAIR